MNTFDTKSETYTSLKAVCSGEAEGQLCLLAINHEPIDPNETAISMLVDVHITPGGVNFVSRFNGKDAFDYPSKFNCIQRMRDGVVYVGESNGFLRIEGNTANSYSLKKYVISSYSDSKDQVFFGTYRGEIVKLHTQNTLHQSAMQIGKDSIDRIHGIGSEFIVAVGNNGFVAKYIDGRWDQVNVPSNARLEAVWCRSKNEIYIGGWEGTVWRWDGDGKWEALRVNFTGDLDDFVFSDFSEFQGILYSANCQHGVYRLINGEFSAVPKVSDEYVSRLSTTTSGLIGLGGVWSEAGSWFVRFDGTKWTAEQITIAL